MPDLDFRVEGAEPQRFAAAPHLLFKLRIAEAIAAGARPTPIHAVALRCQVRIEPSCEPLNSVLPLDVKLSAVTSPLCPVSSPKSWPETASDSLMSQPTPRANTLPSGLKATAVSQQAFRPDSMRASSFSVLWAPP